MIKCLSILLFVSLMALIQVGSAQYVTIANPRAVRVTDWILQPAACLTSTLIGSAIAGYFDSSVSVLKYGYVFRLA